MNVSLKFNDFKVYTVHIIFRKTPVNWNGTKLYFQGTKILEMIMDAILAAGGDDIENVILTGTSGTTKLCCPKAIENKLLMS